MNFIHYCLLIIAVWFLLGLVAKGIIRGNNIGSLRRVDMNDRKDRMSVYWMLRWERVAFLLGPIGLYQVVRRSVRDHTWFSLFRFSFEPHDLGVRLAYTPTYYNGRLIKTRLDTQFGLFVAIGAILLVGFGVWLMRLSLYTRDSGHLAMGILFLVAGIAVPFVAVNARRTPSPQ